ncbi:hypothetical protein WMY93_033609 [Mugilogobius chulae]|uniref:Uncharacterized protein n=1 Tax=Mugilogobius chulae TaxID=88201 RepID=A0AAW0MSR3_9GOBI
MRKCFARGHKCKCFVEPGDGETSAGSGERSAAEAEGQENREETPLVRYGRSGVLSGPGGFSGQTLVSKRRAEDESEAEGVLIHSDMDQIQRSREEVEERPQCHHVLTFSSRSPHVLLFLFSTASVSSPAELLYS